MCAWPCELQALADQDLADQDLADQDLADMGVTSSAINWFAGRMIAFAKFERGQVGDVSRTGTDWSAPPQKFDDLLGQRCGHLRFAVPNDEHLPAICLESSHVLRVARDVADAAMTLREEFDDMFAASQIASEHALKTFDFRSYGQ